MRPSTCPVMPLTLPVHEYCQMTALVHGAGTLKQLVAPPVGSAMKSGYGGRPVVSIPLLEK